MDSLTHLTLGACTGELLLGKKLGKKAMLWGAFAANLPDIDTVAGFFVHGDRALMIHRGITHSLLFAVIIGLLLAFLAKRIYPKIEMRSLVFFFLFQLILHDLLDTCTNYGTGLLEPFSHARFSIEVLYVADPLFTISLLIASAYLIWGRRKRSQWAAIAIIISGIYLGIASVGKLYIDSKTKATLSTPAPFTSLLWYCIIKTDKGYYTGYQSVFDHTPISYGFYPQNDSLLKEPQPDLKAFADEYYTISQSHNQLYFNVLRFGQIQGWQNNMAPFALSYPVNSTGDENMIIQKGRLSGWNKTSIKQYLERIAGK
ncbi:metal-dependent hydrolase [Mucilaginibacter jinjuensis]|uniref:Metal-dependent hydrolase n=1 Tax=Mucilaginibacter jinjuensis TaxID=1176721 RepID=A0ABY7TBH2_9SPHI|nr:metal-dependent hydrolase [Mucilaginibacter jinjuensis]WCT13860.1 metal-dependent hydrolase [Mucilaginibacter jinjuensis]